eukprot:CCRYP_001012-RA/>CCRYP_001012-RA protein AED:0.00 eAED:0.00 QI:189/1/0.5/1/0/0/2/0/64
MDSPTWKFRTPNKRTHFGRSEHLQKGIDIPYCVEVYTMFACIAWTGVQFHCLSILTIAQNIAHK